MDQVVKERERKERVGRGRNGQTTSLDEIEPLEPQRAQRAQHTTFAHHCALSIVAAATLPVRAAARPSTALPYPGLSCPAHGLTLAAGLAQIGLAAGPLAGWRARGGQGRTRLNGWVPALHHWGLTMGIRFDATRLQVPGTEMQVRTGDATAPKLGWKPRPRGFVGSLAAPGCTPDHCRPSVSSISTLRNTHPISRLACL